MKYYWVAVNEAKQDVAKHPNLRVLKEMLRPFEEHCGRKYKYVLEYGGE